MHTNLLQNLFLLLPFTYQLPANDDEQNSVNSGPHWNFDENGADWEGTCATGQRQTPIKLSVDSSISIPIPRMIFGNYDVKLKRPLKLVNKGYTVDMTIPETINGEKPYIAGGFLKGQYVAEGVHFHWGSSNSRGSEHLIHNKRYHGEMHIVHRNRKYPNINEALKYSDGVAVLGILLKIIHIPDRIFPGMRKIFAAVPKITKYHAETTLPGSISLGQLLGDLNTRDFYTYRGSLTTPQCNEAVIWTVFAQPLPIPISDMSKLWELQDSDGNEILNNFRIIQPRNNRPVFYRLSTKDYSFYQG